VSTHKKSHRTSQVRGVTSAPCPPQYIKGTQHRLSIKELDGDTMSFRGLFSLGRGEQQAQGGTNNAPTACAPRDSDEHLWLSANLDDASAPNVGGQFGRHGSSVQFDLPRETNTFGMGNGGPAQGPPAYIVSQYREEGRGNEGATMTQQGRMATMPAQGVATQTAPVVSPNAGYSGMATAIAKWGIGDEISQTTKLRWQQGVEGDRTRADQFCEVVGALQAFRTYLFIKPGSAFCTVIHSPLKFVAITEATQQLQGRIIGFVGDRTLTKEPTPVLLPQ
jgi:hypothetical protein